MRFPCAGGAAAKSARPRRGRHPRLGRGGARAHRTAPPLAKYRKLAYIIVAYQIDGPFLARIPGHAQPQPKPRTAISDQRRRPPAADLRRPEGARLRHDAGAMGGAAAAGAAGGPQAIGSRRSARHPADHADAAGRPALRQRPDRAPRRPQRPPRQVALPDAGGTPADRPHRRPQSRSCRRSCSPASSRPRSTGCCRSSAWRAKTSGRQSTNRRPTAARRSIR